MKFLLYFYLFSQVIVFTLGGKILVIQAVPTKSYRNMMNSIVNVLAPYHEITYYDSVQKEYDHPNVTLIYIPPMRYSYLNQSDIFTRMLTNDDSTTDSEGVMLGLSQQYMEYHLKLDIFQDLIRNRPKYDALIICYAISEFLIPFAHYLNVPLIQVSASVPLMWQNYGTGNPTYLAYEDTMFTSEEPSNIYNRLVKYLKHVKIIINYNWFYLPYVDKTIKKYFPSSVPSIESLNSNTSLILVNTVDQMGYIRPSLSNYLTIGGLNCKPAKTLPEDLLKFVEESGEHGVVYFSFGSTFQFTVPDKVIRIFINVFKRLKQRVIWKSNNKIEDLPSNVMTLKWCPQQDILGHNKTRVFITQGGILSLQESVYHGVPALVLPISLDQPSNAKLVQQVGWGRYLPLSKFSEETLYAELQELLTNEKYKTKAKQISSLMKDVQLSPAEKLKWWIDYIIRHKGFPMYKLRDERNSWTKNVDIDILLVLQFCLLFSLLTVIVFVQFLSKQLMNLYVQNKIKIS